MAFSSDERRRFVLRVIFLSFAALLLIGTAVFLGLPLIYSSHPELFAHRDFYTRCKKINPGAKLQDARVQMAPYLEVGRTWSPDDPLRKGLFTATVVGASENSEEYGSRIIFIPDSKNIADWCIVYPENGRVVRVEISPD